MRITKKYTGNSSIGKRTFTPLVRTAENIPYIEMSQRELEDLRRNWISKLLLAEQWNNRKMNMMKTSTPGAGGNSPSLHQGGLSRTFSGNYLDTLDARNAHDLNNSSHGSVGALKYFLLLEKKIILLVFKLSRLQLGSTTTLSPFSVPSCCCRG